MKSQRSLLSVRLRAIPQPIVPLPISLTEQPLVTLELDDLEGPLYFTETVSSDVLGGPIPSTDGPCVVAHHKRSLTFDTRDSGMRMTDRDLPKTGITWDSDTSDTAFAVSDTSVSGDTSVPSDSNMWMEDTGRALIHDTSTPVVNSGQNWPDTRLSLGESGDTGQPTAAAGFEYAASKKSRCSD